MIADWTQIPIGVGIAALLIREASRFIKEHQGDKDGHSARIEDGNIGSKSVEFWAAKQREIVYTEIDRHIMPRLDELDRKLSAVHDNVRELRWRGQQGRKNE